jgi:hypothetical protein
LTSLEPSENERCQLCAVAVVWIGKTEVAAFLVHRQSQRKDKLAPENQVMEAKLEHSVRGIAGWRILLVLSIPMKNMLSPWGLKTPQG